MITLYFKISPFVVRIYLSMILGFSVATISAQSLPDVFIGFSGEKVKSIEDWYTKRQPEIVRFFEKEVYGQRPVTNDFSFAYKIIEAETIVLKGKAYRKQVRMFISNNHHDTLTVDLLIYYPVKSGKMNIPVFTLLNYGNHTLTEDTDIRLSISKLYTIEKERGSFKRRFPIETIIDSGCGVITSCYEDFIPDNDIQFRRTSSSFYAIPPDSTGAISIWAWAYSCMVDFALQQSFIDPKKIAVIGQSRTGKAALWAAATDDRIGYACINESGNSGAKLNFHYDSLAETIEQINTGFPYWFNKSYKGYNQMDIQRNLPFDQHWLIASVAPRRVYVAVAKEDYWGDPEGQFVALKEAEKLYNFLGLKTHLPSQMPMSGEAITSGYCGFHIREGKHDLLTEDWKQYLKFIKQ